nr:MAG TPA: hypothetical protein [Caudoviricetes sp.]
MIRRRVTRYDFTLSGDIPEFNGLTNLGVLRNAGVRTRFALYHL